MDRYEKCSLVALFIAYNVIILLIVIYEITECIIAPELKMSNREKGRKKTKPETSTQYKVTDPISMADLETFI